MNKIEIDIDNFNDIYVKFDYIYYKISCLYWAAITMTTIGYGDITPTNNTEKLFVTIYAIFSSCIFAYIIN
jgi:hypothetical protein